MPTEDREWWTPDELRTRAAIVARIANEVGGQEQDELEAAAEALFDAANHLESR